MCLGHIDTLTQNSWYQPAIDAFGHALMECFNKLPGRLASAGHAPATELQPVVYVTYQAYLRRFDTALLTTSYSLMLERLRISRAPLHSHDSTTTL